MLAKAPELQRIKSKRKRKKRKRIKSKSKSTIKTPGGGALGSYSCS